MFHFLIDKKPGKKPWKKRCKKGKKDKKPGKGNGKPWKRPKPGKQPKPENSTSEVLPPILNVNDSFIEDFLNETNGTSENLGQDHEYIKDDGFQDDEGEEIKWLPIFLHSKLNEGRFFSQAKPCLVRGCHLQ